VIRTVLVDDEIDSILVLTRLLESYCPQIKIVGKAEGVESALEVIRVTDPDLVFLDIEMIQGNAFDLLNRLPSITFQVIFVTAFDNHAIRAFKYSAVDYLLKPVDIDDLRTAVNKVTERARDENVVGRMKLLLENMTRQNVPGQKMAIPTLDGLSFIPMFDIIWLESKGNYTHIHFSGGTAIVSTRTIKEYEDMLPESIFFRVHSSFIINLQRIQKYQKGRGGNVIMEDGCSIEVAARRRNEFLQQLLK
jgi:two-component system LytT family response regulator